MQPMSREGLDQLARVIVDSAISVHKEMGPGLLESVYQHCMMHELRSRNVFAAASVPVPLVYKGVVLHKEYVMDLVVDDEIILELKAIDNLLPVHEAQIISYLKLADKRLGFLINFNVPLLKQGIKRFVNNF